MTEPSLDLIRDALDQEAARYSPRRTRDQVREQVLERLHRRRQRDRLVLGAGILAVLLAAGVAVPQFLSPDVGGGREVRTVGGQELDVASDGFAQGTPSEGDVGFGVPVTGGSTTASIPVSTTARSPVGTVSPPGTSVSPEPLVTSPPGGSTPATTMVAPASTTPVIGAGTGVAGRLVRDLGCPARTDPPQSGCSVGPAQGAIQVLRPDGGIAATAQTANDGSFRIDLAPGQYVVQAAAASGCAAAPVRVVVESGRHIPVTLTCDSGVR